jgi:ADP-ribose pyrophosphatase YjhB (NUDIX family)
MSKSRFKVYASVHVIFQKDNKILLSRRKNITSDGLWSLVAGHLDGGETVTEACIREAQEEVGVNINPKDIAITTVCHSYSSHNKREFIQFYTICKRWKGELINNEPDKCSELKFFLLDELPDDIVPYVKDGIKKTFARVYFYEYGWEEENILG